ncbi:MAG TPA: fused MFS/spermidine synthase [Sphingomicrobium sp.]
MAAKAEESGRSGSVRARFVATIFTSSFLLFLVQPMIARMALPRLGGAPSVWNSAMLVYQALLLAGYGYAHWLGRVRPQRQAAIHIGLLVLAGLTLPIGLMSSVPPPDANPFLWVPWLLLLSVGPLFFVVSAQAPLLQRWFALSDGGDPYPLYAASNLGSFVGLIAYPLLAEPLLAVSQQRWLWTVGYSLLVLLVGWCAFGIPRLQSSRAAKHGSAAAPDWRLIGKWIVLAAVPSGLILSTTLHITTDLVAMPLLWVLPLGAYLLSFTVAFAERRGAANSIIRLAPLLLLLGCFGVFIDFSWLVLAFGAISIINLFTVSVALHSRLFESRPPTQHLTLFYFAMSIGGALGGAFCALIAPLIFDWTYEHLLLLVAAAWMMRGQSPFDRFAKLWDGSANARRITIAGIIALVVLAVAGKGVLGLAASAEVNRIAGIAVIVLAIFAIGNRMFFTAAVAALLIAAGGWEKLQLTASPGKMTRSFFGIYSIRPGANDSRRLVHGTTLHGVQNLGSPERERMETTYYAPLSGVGLAMQEAPVLLGPQARVAIVGLGAGTLACYAQPGQSWTFYEIDPAVVRIARDPARFTFVTRCTPDAQIKVGDARLLIEREPAGSKDVLAVDAFSSDSVPMHLLTAEAFADYRRLLSPRGLLLVHISNRYLDLKPVVAAAAAAGGWNASIRKYRPDAEAIRRNETGSDWIALSPSRETLDGLVQRSGQKWDPLPPRAGFAPWTDDHASVLPLISFAGI